jgi:pimeloyl-ACP methyl ester carboxylesterase
MAMLTVGSEEGARVELYYEDRGAGRPVVLVHGLLQDGRSWERQVGPLLTARLLPDLNTNVSVFEVDRCSARARLDTSGRSQPGDPRLLRKLIRELNTNDCKRFGNDSSE